MAVAVVALSGLFRRPSISDTRLHQGGLPLRRRPTRFSLSGGDAASSPWQHRRRGGRRRRTSKKWNQKKMDTEFDLVIVPVDGVSMSGSDSGDSDWSVGWFEPHHANFTDNELEDSFAVLVPCYRASTPQLAQSPFQAQEGPHACLWVNALAKLSMESHEEQKQHLERWLAHL